MSVKKCPTCKGSKIVSVPVFDHDDGSTATETRPCPKCSPTARVPQTGYLVLKALAMFQTADGVTLNLRQKGIFGCAPIYTNKAKAKKDYPGAEIIEVYLPKEKQ